MFGGLYHCLEVFVHFDEVAGQFGWCSFASFANRRRELLGDPEYIIPEPPNLLELLIDPGRHLPEHFLLLPLIFHLILPTLPLHTPILTPLPMLHQILQYFLMPIDNLLLSFHNLRVTVEHSERCLIWVNERGTFVELFHAFGEFLLELLEFVVGDLRRRLLLFWGEGGLLAGGFGWGWTVALGDGGGGGVELVLAGGLF